MSGLDVRLSERVGSQPFFVERMTRTEYVMNWFHYHSSYELFYINSGSVEFIIGGKSYRVFEGNLLVIPPYVQHRSIYKYAKETSRIEIQLSEEQLSANMVKILKTLAEYPCYTISLRQKERILKCIDGMEEETHGVKEYWEDLCQAHICELLVTVYRHAARVQAVGGENVLPQQIMEYISANYQRNITIAELCREFNVCESSVYKAFKKYVGLKITDYLNFTRIMNADRLMCESNLSLTEIAYQCGFNDYNYFSTVFKKYKGMAPGRFMKQCRK